MALLAPVAGLVVLALVGSVVAIVLGLVAPPSYRQWTDRPGL